LNNPVLVDTANASAEILCGPAAILYLATHTEVMSLAGALKLLQVLAHQQAD